MKETIYRCDRCGQIITDTVHRLDAVDENGEKTKYGALFDGIDICESCIEKVAMAALGEISAAAGPEHADEDKEDQTDNPEEAEEDSGHQNDDTDKGASERQQDETASQETPDRQQDEPQKKTHQCSKMKNKCYYSEKVGGQFICGYINIEGHRRGCDPEECDKYKPQNRGRKPKATE